MSRARGYNISQVIYIGSGKWFVYIGSKRYNYNRWEILNGLRFADNIVFISIEVEEMERRNQKLEEINYTMYIG